MRSAPTCADAPAASDAAGCPTAPPPRVLGALFGLGMVCLLAGIFVPINAVTDGDPAFYGMIAKNILKTGDWLTLHHAGWQVIDKPPLTFWIMALGFAAFGASEQMLRAWHSAAAALVVLSTYALARLALPRQQALLAALILLVSAMFFYESLIPQQDIPLTLFITSSVYWHLRWERGGRGFAAMLSWLSAALAVLTKGLIGLAFPAMIVGIHLVVDRPRLPRRALPIAAAGLLLFVVTAAPWFVIGYLRQGPEFVNTFFVNGKLGIGRFFRLVQTSAPTTVPQWAGFGAYLPLLFFGMLPWVGWLWPALREGWTARGRGASAVRACAVWVTAVFAFLSLSLGDKTLRYLLPLTPPLAVLIARVIGANRFQGQAAGTALLAAAVLAATAIVVPRLHLPDFAAAYLSDASYTSYVPLFEWFVLATVACLVAYAVAVWRRRAGAGIAVLAGLMLLTHALVMGWLSASWDRLSPWRPLARIVNRIPGPPSRVLIIDAAAVGGHNNFADFYIDRPVDFVNRADLLREWRRGPVLAVVTPETLQALPDRPAPVVIRTIPSGLAVVTNTPIGKPGAMP